MPVGITGIVAGTASVVSFIVMNDAKKNYRGEFEPARQIQLENKYTTARVAGIICAGVAGICLPVSAMLFIKNGKQTRKTVSIYFSPARGPGLGVAVRF